VDKWVSSSVVAIVEVVMVILGLDMGTGVGDGKEDSPASSTASTPLPTALRAMNGCFLPAKTGSVAGSSGFAEEEGADGTIPRRFSRASSFAFAAAFLRAGSPLRCSASLLG